MLLNEKAWYQNNTLRIKESNLEVLEQNTIDSFFHSDEEQELEEGFGKKLLTTAVLAGLSLYALFAGINSKGTKDTAQFLPQELVKQGIQFVQDANPGGTSAFLAPETEGGTGKLIVAFKPGNAPLQQQTENEVRKFCQEKNIDLEKWDFDEYAKGFYDPTTGNYVAIFEVTRAN